MIALYQAEAVRRSMGNCLRPGGIDLTRRLLATARISPESRIFDAGCGPGTSLQLLKNDGYSNIFGIDRDFGFLTEARDSAIRTAQADLTRLPIADNSLDLILCECVWNLTDTKTVLREFRRVLKPSGLLLLADIYLRTPQASRQTWPVTTCLAGARPLPETLHEIESTGFLIEQVDDHTDLLKQAAAEFVFAYGSLQGFWQAVTGEPASAAQACSLSAAVRPGLFSILGKRL